MSISLLDPVSEFHFIAVVQLVVENPADDRAYLYPVGEVSLVREGRRSALPQALRLLLHLPEAMLPEFHVVGAQVHPALRGPLLDVPRLAYVRRVLLLLLFGYAYVRPAYQGLAAGGQDRQADGDNCVAQPLVILELREDLFSHLLRRLGEDG